MKTSVQSIPVLQEIMHMKKNYFYKENLLCDSLFLSHHDHFIHVLYIIIRNILLTESYTVHY